MWCTSAHTRTVSWLRVLSNHLVICVIVFMAHMQWCEQMNCVGHKISGSQLFQMLWQCIVSSSAFPLQCASVGVIAHWVLVTDFVFGNPPTGGTLSNQPNSPISYKQPRRARLTLEIFGILVGSMVLLFFVMGTVFQVSSLWTRWSLWSLGSMKTSPQTQTAKIQVQVKYNGVKRAHFWLFL